MKVGLLFDAFDFNSMGRMNFDELVFLLVSLTEGQIHDTLTRVIFSIYLCSK